MTKKDYEAIAGLLREQKNQTDPEAIVADLVWGLADLMQADNPRFDRTRFLAACRGEDSKDSAGRKVRYSRTSDAVRRDATRLERKVKYAR